MFDTKQFGIYLSQKRKECGMTQSELAEKLCLTRQAVSKYETGGSFPDISILIKIAKVFSVTLDELINLGSQSEILQRILDGEIDWQLIGELLPYMESVTQHLEAAVFEGALPNEVIAVINKYWLEKTYGGTT
jgi:transcriptional regulator with XRE-family HTH domain